MTQYIAVLHKDEGSVFGVSFPDFPGCVSAGETLEEAQVNAAQALAFHIEGMVEDGEAIPEATAIGDLDFDALAGGLAFPVAYKRELKTVRINITVREDHLDAIDTAAEAAGKNRSGYLVDAALDKINAGRYAGSVTGRWSMKMPEAEDRRLYIATNAPLLERIRGIAVKNKTEKEPGQDIAMGLSAYLRGDETIQG